MKGALVIRYGDPDIAEAIANGMDVVQAKKIKDSELALVRNELEKLKVREARLGVRTVRDENYYREKIALANEYYTLPKGNRVTDALWGLYGLLVLIVDGFQDWVYEEMRKGYSE